MSKQDNQPAKYHVEINQSQGAIIGDYAHVEQHFHAVSPPLSQATRDELLAALWEANAELRDYPDEIAGIHLERKEVAQVVEWIHQADPTERLGMVLDKPGSGKTVVMHEVLIRLEDEKVPVLAIKADFLSGINNRDDLSRRLGLPAPVETCASQLAAEGRFVVLLDQLDALSLSLSRDQETLDIMLSMLARLRNQDNVRIVTSCRTFDLNNDPRLSQVKVDRKFQLQPLAGDQVDRVLNVIGVAPTHLLSAHRELLATPLHLDVYARVITADNPSQPSESFHTLQELYEALWRKRIEVVPPDSPRPAERVAAIYRLVEAMQNNSRIAIPVAVIDDLSEAATYLESINFIRREDRNWLFFHETLFDYCYARRFVARGKSLSQQILNGPQGLFERSQIVQILAYLRGANEVTYRRELVTLLFSDNLRIHLRLLLIGWFGSLPDPSADELRIARRLIKDDDGCTRFFQAVGGNEGWFNVLREGVLPALLRSQDEQLVNTVMNYMGTMVQPCTDEVLAYLHPYLGKSEIWDKRISFCLSRLDTWQSDEALDMLCDLLRRGRTVGYERSHLLSLAQSNPAAGCRALNVYLSQRLDSLLAQEQAAQQEVTKDLDLAYHTGISNIRAAEQYLLGEKYAVSKIMERGVQECPDKVVEHLLPWFIRVALLMSGPEPNQEDYPFDPLFASYWYGEHISDGAAFAVRMSEALQHVSQRDPSSFRAIASVLLVVESLAVQRVLAQAYLADPQRYADDIFEYLLTDSRRLHMGEMDSSHYDSRRLFVAAFRHLDTERRLTLEQLILELKPAWESRTRGHYGITQLHFLKAVSADLLSEAARRRRQELAHKFPDFELTVPKGIEFRQVPPPIKQEALAKMSDEAWLGSMRKYDDSTAWDAPREDPLKGGVIEHSRAFAEQVKIDPERFYQLAQRFDATISLYYIEAAISGLAESSAPSEWVFELVNRFATCIEGEFRRGVCRALTKRAEDGVPDELLDMMADWALHDLNPEKEMWRIQADSGQPSYRGDPFQYGINTNRGAAIQAACRCALKCRPPQFELAFQLLEQAADDSSTSVRACIVNSLGPFINEDAERTLAIFERTMEGHPVLLQSPLVHRFLWWVYYEHFPRTRPFIETLLAHPEGDTHQAGARLACLAVLHYAEAEDLSEQAATGNTTMRRGAAQVYARNLEKQDVREICRKRLLQLMNDPDEEVRKHVGECFQYLQSEDLDDLRPFVEAFLDSPSLLPGAQHLIEYLNPLATDEHQLALRATTRILDTAGNEIVAIHSSMAILERDLVRLPLTVYTHTIDQEIRFQAMSLFEKLLLLGSHSAHQALDQWDRR